MVLIKLQPLTNDDIVVWKNEYRTNEMGKYRLNFGDFWFTDRKEAQEYRKTIIKSYNDHLKKNTQSKGVRNEV